MKKEQKTPRNFPQEDTKTKKQQRADELTNSMELMELYTLEKKQCIYKRSLGKMRVCNSSSSCILKVNCWVA